MTLRLICFFILIDVITGATNCKPGDLRFEKVIGVKPDNSNHPLLLYRNNDSSPVTTECIERCKKNTNCRSFVLYYNISSCYWFKSTIQGVQELENELDTNTDWFVKACLRVKTCSKLWVVERIPGATLVGNDTKILPNTYTRTECQQNCLNQTRFSCRSAKFKIDSTAYGPNDEVRGTCILSNSDRHLQASSYRASSFNDEYFENQCSEDVIENENEFCSYEEFDNATLANSDVLVEEQTKAECQKLCEQTKTFNCRGFSLIQNGKTFNCVLHSEDSKIHGPRFVQEKYKSTYFEKAQCLNLSIICSETYMTVTFTPSTRFSGRMYMEGYSEQPECAAKGNSTSPVDLKIPVLSEQCGILTAVAQDNRTFVTGTMIIQYNPLVQTQGDRTIKVGCMYGNNSNKSLVGTGITVTTGPSKGSPLINSTETGNPTVEMRVLDLDTQQEVSSTQLGQQLQLLIEVRPIDIENLDIWAGHLVAMTENSEESILLLDDRGCPTNLNIFPGLTKIVTRNSIKLVATFQAFRFSASPIVRFSVIVRFCQNSCPTIDCGNGQRQKRSLETINGTTVLNVNRSEFENEPRIYEMPLEFIMIVRKNGANAEKLVLGDGKILIAGYDFTTDEVCIDYSLFVGLIVAWILIQIIFVVCGIILVRRYKKYYEHASSSQSMEQLHKNFDFGFGNLDNRRVHWADNGEYT